VTENEAGTRRDDDVIHGMMREQLADYTQNMYFEQVSVEIVSLFMGDASEVSVCVMRSFPES
jgi:hypothetical protein